MAANSTESSSKEPEATKAATSAPSESASGLKPWLPLIVTVVAMPALAYGMTQFYLLPQLKKGMGITASARVPEAAPVKEETSGPRESFPMTKLLVNVSGTMGARYLQVSLSVVGSGADFKAKMEAHDPQLRDMACGALATKTLADLEKPGVRNVIRSELISGFNNILGSANVQEIYLTEFAIQ
jgi:flagellar protein FliL